MRTTAIADLPAGVAGAYIVGVVVPLFFRPELIELDSDLRAGGFLLDVRTATTNGGTFSPDDDTLELPITHCIAKKSISSQVHRG